MKTEREFKCKGCGKRRDRPVAHHHPMSRMLCGPWVKNVNYPADQPGDSKGMERR